jgi:hypothetical protein
MPNPFAALYDAGLKVTGGACPIEAGAIGRLADHECRHGRLPSDRAPACGCWPREGATIIALPARPGRRNNGRLPEAA